MNAAIVLSVAAGFAGGLMYNRHASALANPHRILYYHDPMHPEYKSDKPGIAPDCGMALEPVYADAPPSLPVPGSSGEKSVAPAIQVDIRGAQAGGIASEPVEMNAYVHTIRAPGRVVPDETRIFRMVAGSEGWVREIRPVITGTLVHKGDLLAIYYGRDFQAAQQSYIYALKNRELSQGTAPKPGAALPAQSQVDSALDNLMSMGISEDQIKELERTRQTSRNIELRASVTGFVLTNNVFTGMRFERGTELVRIADLRHIWVAADLFGDEGSSIVPGSVVEVSIPGASKLSPARVSASLPQFDPESKTTKVRLELDNPGYLLRPGMFVDVQIPVRLPPSVHVPSDAVIDSGQKKTVFIAKGSGVYEPRTVQTGWHFGDQVQLLQGVAPGERVVRSGAFLLDSETRMKGIGNAADDQSAASRDPVCGMTLPAGKAAGGMLSNGGSQYQFCSKRCRDKFEANPERFATAARR